jgi:hypothetical protein
VPKCLSHGNAQRTDVRVYTWTSLQRVLEGCRCNLLRVIMDHTAFVLPSKTQKHIVMLSQGCQKHNICRNACQARANCIILMYHSMSTSRVQDVTAPMHLGLINWPFVPLSTTVRIQSFLKGEMTLLQANSLLPPASSMTPHYSRMPGCKQAGSRCNCHNTADSGPKYQLFQTQLYRCTYN